MPTDRNNPPGTVPAPPLSLRPSPLDEFRARNPTGRGTRDDFLMYSIHDETMFITNEQIGNATLDRINTMSVRTHVHRPVQSNRVRDLLSDLRDVTRGRYARYYAGPNPGSMTAAPVDLLCRIGDALDQATTQEIRFQVAEPDRPINPVTQATAPPAPPVTGISPEHMELLRKVVDAGVEWDMMSAEEGQALLKSVGAVKPSPAQGSKTERLQSVNDAWLSERLNEISSETIPGLIALTEGIVGRNTHTAATGILAQVEEARRRIEVETAILAGNFDTRPFGANITPMEIGDIDRFRITRSPERLRVPDMPPAEPVPTPYPPPRSRFSRPRGR